ncbi:hypothetical protein GCM10007860_25940 [Chitiniphilus shinanonensis]|uniref:Uncharacterized protein n=1 Tax=Chitiniphilus shinanonensis TaxID=553088 RepID=A0ABQ6BY49_9NEIS|nr:hypothetical protein [Chitiniphilus shinanonensis]GLS05441.1 hypothetical protein GCM10007860_25940 [Chitiniphilus shinanonensis]
MHEDCYQFLEKIAVGDEGMQETIGSVFDYWLPDDPPLTMLFSEVGEKIVDELFEVGWLNDQERFFLIEKAMNDADGYLKTAVATGLIEAMLSRASRYENGLSEILKMLGQKSRKHADAWLNF